MPEASSNRRDSVESERSALVGARVLVVEDSWDFSASLKRLLETCGAEVLGPVATLNDAKRLLSERIPDAALVDINLRSGELSYGLIDEMRALSIPIVVITGYAKTSPAMDPAVAILQKPFRLDQLLAALNSAKTGSI